MTLINKIAQIKTEIEKLGIPTYNCEAELEKEQIGFVNKPSDLAIYIDHTALNPETNSDDIKNLCEEARKYNFKGVCINPLYIKAAKKLLDGSKCLIITVVDFPLGANTAEEKVCEAKDAINLGADEIDMVISVGLLKNKEYGEVFDGIRKVVEASKTIPVKVIIETCLLEEEEKMAACLLAKKAGAAFVKTSTGFSTSGSTVEDVKLMRTVIGDTMGVKAAGGIRDFESAKSMVEAGANRLGSSASVKIVTET